jgi:hypothetical protein
MVCALVGVFCIFSQTVFPRCLEGIQQQTLARQSQRCPRDCSSALAVVFLELAQGLLSRFVCVYLGYITQGCAGGAVAGCYEPTCQMLVFPYTPRVKHRHKE